MTNILKAISKPIDQHTQELLFYVARIAKMNNINFFVVGATARDMILLHVHGLSTGRATRDIDIACAVRTWKEYEWLSSQLLMEGRFTKDRQSQRFIFHNNLPLDLIPFGEIETTQHKITWPPDHTIEMNIAGFSEAYDAALTLEIDGGVNIRVASLPGLVLMKLIAWNHNPLERAKDAEDLMLIIHSYIDAGNQGRLYSEHLDLVTENFDLMSASARILGRDISSIVPVETKMQVQNILQRETSDVDCSRLVDGMMKGRSSVDGEFQRVRSLLLDMKKGMDI